MDGHAKQRGSSAGLHMVRYPIWTDGIRCRGLSRGCYRILFIVSRPSVLLTMALLFMMVVVFVPVVLLIVAISSLFGVVLQLPSCQTEKHSIKYDA